MDIQSASDAAQQIPTSGRAGAAESAANVSKIAADSTQERKELGKPDSENANDSGSSGQKSYTASHVGNQVDVVT